MARDRGCVTPSAGGVTQTVTHGVTHRTAVADRTARSRPVPRRRPAGPYLQLRGRTYYFRKRLTTAVSHQRGQPFLCTSLRTQLLSEAMSSAARLLNAVEQAERQIMQAMETRPVTRAEIDAVLAEALRGELRRISDVQAGAAARDDGVIDARIEELEDEVRRLRRAARRNDFALVAQWCAEAADTVGVPISAGLAPEFGREALRLKQAVTEVEARVEDGEDVAHAAAPLVADYAASPVAQFMAAPVTISQAYEKARELYLTPSMQSGMAASCKLFKELIGDIPVDLLTRERQKELFELVAQLPRTHGKRHGKNRFTAEGATLPKREEIERADAADAVVTEEIRAMSGLSTYEKRARLAERLTPRVTFQNVKKHRDVLHRFVRAARELGAAAQIRVLGDKEIERAIAGARPDDALYLRVTKPKTRLPWTPERMSRLLTSPIYTGCASQHRRWLPGDVIIRDATYWVPLLVMSTGARLHEVLQLKRTSLVRRDGVLCLAIGLDADEQIKTSDSARFLPIPQLLLDLGFDAWLRALPEERGAFLFPEALERSTVETPSDAFGKHLKHLFARLDLADYDEDFYALRKTLSSKLSDIVSDGMRQALLGHKSGDILNRHYTAFHARKLKANLDAVDFGAVVEPSKRHGFPVILRCNLGAPKAFDVSVDLGENGAPEVIRVMCGESLCLEASITAGGATLRDGEGRIEHVTRADAADHYRALLATGVARFPRNPQKRRALEHFDAIM